MIKNSITKILHAVSRFGERENGFPGLIFLDTFGEEIANGFSKEEKSSYGFRLGKGGVPELVNVPSGIEWNISKVEIYGKPVGFLVVVDRAQFRDSLGLFSQLAGSMVSLAAEKDFELDDLSAALNRFFEEKSFLYEITAELGDSSDLKDFCARLAQRMAGILDAQSAVVLLASEDRKEYRIVGSHGFSAQHPDSYPVEEGICGEVISTGRGKLIEDVGAVAPGVFKGFEAEASRCMLVAPLTSETSGGGLGALAVMDGGRSGNFTSEEQSLLVFIAEYVASVISGLYLVELKKEVQIAQKIIEGLLPDRAPKISGFQLAGKLLPARVVGGDYYQYLPLPGGRTGVLIADVSGHSMPATLLVTIAHAAFRWAAEDADQASPSTILHQVSARLFHDLSSAEKFMSLFLCVLGENGEVHYSNAGHPPALLYRAKENSFEDLDTEGMIAGVLKEIEFEEKKLQMNEGDRLVLFTDGITEAADPQTQEWFGRDRLKEVIRKASLGSAEEIVEAIFGEISSYSGGEAMDDLTVVVIQGTSALVPAGEVSRGSQS